MTFHDFAVVDLCSACRICWDWRGWSDWVTWPLPTPLAPPLAPWHLALTPRCHGRAAAWPTVLTPPAVAWRPTVTNWSVFCSLTADESAAVCQVAEQPGVILQQTDQSSSSAVPQLMSLLQSVSWLNSRASFYNKLITADESAAVCELVEQPGIPLQQTDPSSAVSQLMSLLQSVSWLNSLASLCNKLMSLLQSVGWLNSWTSFYNILICLLQSHSWWVCCSLSGDWTAWCLSLTADESTAVCQVG